MVRKMLERLNDTTYKEKVEEASGRVCVEFYADWCGWCKRQEAISERIMEAGSDVPIYMMNGDEHPQITQEMNIMGYPTYVLFENGEKIGILVGAHPEQEVRDFLNS